MCRSLSIGLVLVVQATSRRRQDTNPTEINEATSWTKTTKKIKGLKIQPGP
ncbi:unnamed protein product [Amoebophrya sp. A25]|nr:unnamed protein product [Amoebophrya sp. A25]|eukprot:GSA25T00014733001.1